MDNEFGGKSFQYYTAEDFVLPFSRPNKRIDCFVDCKGYEDTLAVKNKVLDVFGDDILVKSKIGEEVVELKACELADFDGVYIPAESNVVSRKRFDFSDLEEILKRLRAKDGCEWDKAQTPESIRANIIEEAYELIEGIDLGDKEKMVEEAGDVILQSAFIAEMSEEEGKFDYADVFTTLCRKLLDRHTHIFGSDHATNAEEALAFWTEAKKKEKKYENNTDAMSRVPVNFPSLLYAEKIQKIAKKSGFDWSEVDDAVEKVKEELNELLLAETQDEKVEEAGDLLFAVVNVLRFFKIDPEIALRDASRKFKSRFATVERLATANGKTIKDYSLSELEEFWNEAKKNVK